MDGLIELIGTILIDILSEIWPPILPILTGAMVLCMGFLSYLFYTTAQPVKAAGSLVAAAVFLAVFFVVLKNGLYTRKTAKKRKDGRRKS